jgi:hypothetical protein
VGYDYRLDGRAAKFLFLLKGKTALKLAGWSLQDGHWFFMFFLITFILLIFK